MHITHRTRRLGSCWHTALGRRWMPAWVNVLGGKERGEVVSVGLEQRLCYLQAQLPTPGRGRRDNICEIMRYPERTKNCLGNGHCCWAW